MMLLSTGTCVGTRTCVFGFGPPACPRLLRPHAQTWPVSSSARECPLPAATAVIRLGSVMGSGVAWGVAPMTPRPNCPSVFCPQLQTTPSLRTASEWYAPAATPWTSRPATTRSCWTFIASGASGSASSRDSPQPEPRASNAVTHHPSGARPHFTVCLLNGKAPDTPRPSPCTGASCLERDSFRRRDAKAARPPCRTARSRHGGPCTGKNGGTSCPCGPGLQGKKIVFNLQ
ncbi:hypothetical protein COSO111634_33765 [Corallococcus soli]